ncbi:unnamed protein product [Ostreobium quekettii]|uniref:Uncharacterized protein n=1 Tax=Ostreobium quekettii TaxID=121088 RepID=A0A8S1J1A2_9CHLO|nr:unnamed protein product [Ostreobium quekettii]
MQKRRWRRANLRYRPRGRGALARFAHGAQHDGTSVVVNLDIAERCFWLNDSAECRRWAEWRLWGALLSALCMVVAFQRAVTREQTEVGQLRTASHAVKRWPRARAG